MKIWIVHGSTGEYSDRDEWVVSAHRTEDSAKAHIAALESAYQGSGIERLDRWDPPWEAAVVAMQALDPRFHHDYTGTRWFVGECELHD